MNGTGRLCTTLCLQYKPHYIAAGSMYLAAKFQKVKLPMEKEKVWWLEFDISPKQLQGLYYKCISVYLYVSALILTHGCYILKA